MGTANAVNTGQVTVVCANDAGEQREYRVGWDNSNSFFNGKGDIAALFCDIATQNQYKVFVSTTLSDMSLRYYQGEIPQDIQTPTPETQTVVVPQETSTSVVPSDTPTVVVETQTPVSESVTTVSDTPSVQHPVETPTVVDTQTSESSTQTIPSETATPVVETPLPTPVPVVEPQPVVVVEPPVILQPEPEPEPLPEVIDEEAPLEEQPLEEQPVVEEQPPVEEPSELPVEEETNESPVEEPVIQEQPEPTPEPLPQPVAEPAPNSQPDVAYEPPTVTLDNGVILTQEEAAAVVLLQNPAELISELFTNPAAVFSALGSVGADMSPEVREKSEKIVLSAVIAGNIATQAAATAGAVAAYRRKP